MTEGERAEMEAIMAYIQQFAANYSDTSPEGVATSEKRKSVLRSVMTALVERAPTLVEKFDRLNYTMSQKQ